MITVFTPTYNRAYILDQLYKSLCSQTNKDFEWVVVDDGSTDTTREYFEKITKEKNEFDIVYICQENGGKHRAINKGVSVAKGEYFFIVDSDDYITENAIEKIYQWINTLPKNRKWAGVSGLKGFSKNEAIGGIGKLGYVDASNLERDKKNLLGDKAEVYVTEVLKMYSFPEFEGENFITEEVVWNAIAYDGYKIRWFDEIIYICDYLGDGLTKNIEQKYAQNPNGVLYWAKNQIKYFRWNLKKQMSAIKLYFRAVKGKKTERQIAKDLGISTFKVYLTLFTIKFLKKDK